MKFRSRLILGYAALAIAASVLFGFFYNYYLDQRYQTNIYNNAKFTSSQVLNTLEGGHTENGSGNPVLAFQSGSAAGHS